MLEIAPKGGTLIVHVPITFRKWGGRKQVVGPDGPTTWAPARSRIDSALVKAIARGFRWRRMLESGTYGSIADLAAAERINSSYLARVLRLTLLAPDIVEAVLDGRAPAGLTVDRAIRPFPVEWEAQRFPDAGT